MSLHTDSFGLKSKIKILLCVILLFIVAAGVICYYFYFNQSESDDELLFAHTICRHGDRNTYLSYPGDPWQDEKYWPGGFAQLTEIGKREHFELGQYFRNRYAKLLTNNECIGNNIHVQSTEKDRNIASASSNLAGIFSNEVNSSCNWTSVPIHTVPFEEEYLLTAEKRCDHFNYLMIEYENTSAYQNLFEENAPLIGYLEQTIGMKLPTITDIVNLYDALLIEKLKNYRLPSWADELMVPNSEFERLALQWYAMFTPTPEMKKLRSGFLLKDILNRFSNKTQQILPSDLTLWMYFSHDVALSDMLNSLGVFEVHYPPYASCVLFELYQHQDEAPYVQIFYKNTTSDVPPVEIPKCGPKCPLNKMYELYNEILPQKSFDEECMLHEGETLPPGGNPENNSL